MAEETDNREAKERLTMVSLRDHFEAMLTSMEKKTDLRFEQLDKAITKAETAMDKRFDSVNEFRAQLSDQQRTFIPRMEWESGHKNVCDKVDELKVRFDKIEAMKQGGNVVWAYILAGISIIIAIVSFILKVGGS